MPSLRSLPPIARSGWISVAVSVALLGLTILGAIGIAQEVESHQRSQAEVAAERVRARNDQFMGRRALAMKAVQGLFAGSQVVEEAEYGRFVAALIRGETGIRALNYIDATRHVRWVAPAAGNEGARDLDLRPLEGNAALSRALASGTMAATDPLALKEGGDGFLLFLPVGGRGEAVVLVTDLPTYLRALRGTQRGEAKAMRVVDGAGRELLADGRPRASAVTVPLVVGDRVWRLEMGTIPHWLDYLPVYLLVLVGLAIWLAALALIWADVFASARLSREVAARTDELRASRDQLRVILDGIADGILVLEPPEGRLLYINDAAAAFLGYPDAARADGSSLAERSARLELRNEQGVPLPPGENPSAWALRGEAVPGMVLRYRQRQSGQERVIVVKANPVMDPDGRVRFAVVILHDITERVAMEGRLKEQLTELQALDRLKSDFLSVVTHELRTPLTSIRGFAEFLEDGIGGTLTPEQAEFVRHVQLNAIQLGTLVDDLLDMARLEAGKFTLRRARIDAAALTREVVDSFGPQSREAELTLSLASPEGPLPAEVDPTRLRQVLSNLLSNAIKFTPAHGTVTVTLAAEAGELSWRVADTGIGIAPDHLPRLFSKFFQVESALNRTYKGTGLGLAITKGLVEAHGGGIVVTSAPGAGTVVTVSLPRHATPDATDADRLAAS